MSMSIMSKVWGGGGWGVVTRGGMERQKKQRRVTKEK